MNREQKKKTKTNDGSIGTGGGAGTNPTSAATTSAYSDDDVQQQRERQQVEANRQVTGAINEEDEEEKQPKKKEAEDRMDRLERMILGLIEVQNKRKSPEKEDISNSVKKSGEVVIENNKPIHQNESKTSKTDSPSKKKIKFDPDESDDDDSDDSDDDNDDYGNGIFSSSRFILHRVPSNPKSSGGLYGETSIPSALPEMPALISRSAAVFHSWKIELIRYLNKTNLIHLIDKNPVDALQLAFDMDCGVQSPEIIRNKFVLLHTKLYATIETATIKVLTKNWFVQKLKYGLPSYGRCPINDAGWIKNFRYGNAHWLLAEISKELDEYQPVEMANLLDKLGSFKHKVGIHPIKTIEYWNNLVEELNSAGFNLPTKVQDGYWYRAIPAEMSGFKEALNAGGVPSAKQIQKRLLAHFRAENIGRQHKPEIGAAGFESPQRRENPDKDQTCEHCGIKGHMKKKCWKLHPELLPEAFKSRSGKKIPEFAACGIELVPEEEVAAFFNTEQAYANKESKNSILPPDFTALFDSAATSHVVNDERLLHDIREVPEVNLTGIVSGAKAVIRKRGSLWLSRENKWMLKDVALVPNAAMNLISLGKLAVAKCSTYLNDRQGTVDFTDHEGKRWRDVMKAQFINGLWIYSREGTKFEGESLKSFVKNLRVDPNARMAIRTEPKKDEEKVPDSSKVQEEHKKTPLKANAGGKQLNVRFNLGGKKNDGQQS
jgi:alpha-D-ribose 1-methylphosphonate 5-triphosphate synthase subunit PhnG